MRLPSQIIITCSHPENLVGAGSCLTYRQNCLFDYVINLACELASVDSEIDTSCFSDAAAGLYQPVGGHRHSLELAISVVKSEIASGEDLLPEHVPSTLVHELETVSASWQQNVSMAFDRLICKITGRGNSLEVQRAAGFLALRRGREIQQAASFPGLRRGRETQRAAGFPALPSWT
jgi:hypothetical protein